MELRWSLFPLIITDISPSSWPPVVNSVGWTWNLTSLNQTQPEQKQTEATFWQNYLKDTITVCGLMMLLHLLSQSVWSVQVELGVISGIAFKMCVGARVCVCVCACIHACVFVVHSWRIQLYVGRWLCTETSPTTVKTPVTQRRL